MPEIPKFRREIPSPDSPELLDQKGFSPVELANYLKFQLSELGARNAHHEFEQLCFQIARKRVYSNLIPSTGPVSAGGDQGSDFETYAVKKGSTSPFFATASDEKAVFACSLEKNYKHKIKADIATILKANQGVREIKFFSSGSIPKGVRYDLQEFARKTYNVDLEIFDAEAISNWLSDPELFWIAIRFLNIPSQVFPKAIAEEVAWYNETLTLAVDPANATTEQFFRIRDALRFAVTDTDRHSDIPALISKLRIFRVGGLKDIQRRAFYEEFVASLRALEYIEDCSDGLAEYFAAIPSLEGTAEIEDATVLLNFSIGAHLRGLGKISPEQLKAWRKSLLDRIEQLLATAGSPGRRAALMDSKGLALLSSWPEVAAAQDDQERLNSARERVKKAIGVWNKMLKLVRHVPMFPLDGFARRLPLLAPDFAEVDGYSELSKETDKLLAQRAGQQRVAKQAFARAKSYNAAGQTLKAIDELHQAHFSAFTNETSESAVRFALFLAKLYSKVGLFAAAKYYALASSYAALYLKDDTLKSLASRGLNEAMSADYAIGASLEVFHSLTAAMYLSSEYSSAQDQEFQSNEWNRSFFYAFLLIWESAQVSAELHKYLKDDLLQKLGLKDFYDDISTKIEPILDGCDSYAEIARRVVKEGIAPPFLDLRDARRLNWDQLGLNWHVEWVNDYETTAIAEGFVAMLQILLTDLRDVELSLLQGDIDISIELHDGALEIKDMPDNERVVKKVLLPRKQLDPVFVFSVAASILSSVSAYPQAQFLKIIEARMKAGILGKTNPYASYQRIFEEFYPKAEFESLHSLARDTTLPVPDFSIKTAIGLGGALGLHKDYDQQAHHKMIENRYRNSTRGLKLTLPRLLQDKSFSGIIDALRNEGWKDWHILLAASNIRGNYVIGTLLPPTADPKQMTKLMGELFNREELESDPQPPTDLFTLEEFHRALEMSQISTLRQLGFDCSQRTPNLTSINEFLRRFNYWTDDVSHDDPFLT